MLQVSNLSKRYVGADVDVLAVDGLSLSVPRGRIVGFVGPNGAGKSTTMRSVFGLVDPDEGTITWDGTPVTPAITSRFGYMPEQRGLYPKMKIAEQVSCFAQLKMATKSDADRDAREILTSLGLEDRLNDPLEKLSHGNQQRVQLAVSLANAPEMLILDEPFNGLDPVAVKTLQEVLTRRVRAGTGVLFSSHQLDLVERLCDEVVMISKGRVRAAGTVHEVRAASGRRVVEIAVDKPLTPLADALGSTTDGITLVSHTTATATVEVYTKELLPELLQMALAAGDVTRFSYDMPSLTNIFEDLVSSEAEEALL